MKKYFILIMVTCIALFLCCCAEEVAEDDGTLSFNGKKYICTFSDEFESEKLDNHNWYYCPQQQRQDAGGWWSNSCSTFEDGNYVITCTTKEDGTPISGGIRSRGKFQQTYGLYNIRFKVEKAEGLWYAFWLMTDKMGDTTTVGNGATDGAEIDIIEIVPHEKSYYTTIHWARNPVRGNISSRSGKRARARHPRPRRDPRSTRCGRRERRRDRRGDRRRRPSGGEDHAHRGVDPRPVRL